MAHDFDKKWRSQDVQLQENVDFSGMFLTERVLCGLLKAGFKKPSPIQLAAIPVGRICKDLIVQAKSGTGKTLVFVIIALELLKRKLFRPQVLVIVPTREIATQICSVIKSVGAAFPKLTCCSFIGGLPLVDDKEKAVTCQIAVGTPGRIKQLITLKALPTNSIRLLVLDEADQLFHRSFKQDVEDIFKTLPFEKQVITTSATYPAGLTKMIFRFVRNPYVACLNTKELALLGITQYAAVVKFVPIPILMYRNKLAALEGILKTMKFSQCLLFCNGIQRVEVLYKDVKKWGFSTTYMSSAKEQCDRLKAIDRLKHFKCKVLVSSDVAARGIDAEHVDLVINFDMINTAETHLHRVGRAGRYGSLGVAITIINEREIGNLKKIEEEGSFKTYILPDPVPADLIRNPILGDYVIEESQTDQKLDEDKVQISAVVGDQGDAVNQSNIETTDMEYKNISNENDNDLLKLLNVTKVRECTSETKTFSDCVVLSDDIKHVENNFGEGVSSVSNKTKSPLLDLESDTSSSENCPKFLHFGESNITKAKPVDGNLIAENIKVSENKNSGDFINLEVISSTSTDQVCVRNVNGKSNNSFNEDLQSHEKQEAKNSQQNTDLTVTDNNDNTLYVNLEKKKIESVNKKSNELNASDDVFESFENKDENNKLDNKLNYIVETFINEYEKDNVAVAYESIKGSQMMNESGVKVVTANMINSLSSANSYFYKVFKKYQENENGCQSSSKENEIQEKIIEVSSESFQNEDSEKSCALNIVEQHGNSDISNIVEKSSSESNKIFLSKPSFESTPQVDDDSEHKNTMEFKNKHKAAARSKLLLMFQDLSDDSDSDKEINKEVNLDASPSFSSESSDSESSSDSSDFSSSSSSSFEEETDESISQYKYHTKRQNPSLISNSSASLRKNNYRYTRKHNCSKCTCNSAKPYFQPPLLPPLSSLPRNIFDAYALPPLPPILPPLPSGLPPLPYNFGKTQYQPLHHSSRKNVQNPLQSSELISDMNRRYIASTGNTHRRNSSCKYHSGHAGYSNHSEHRHTDSCFKPSQHRCHPDTKDYPCNHRKLCAQMYESFCRQWQSMQNMLN